MDATATFFYYIGSLVAVAALHLLDVFIVSIFHFIQGISGALEVLMKDAIRPNLMQTLEVKFCL